MNPYESWEPTKLDSTGSATRQKSCNACVRGKRRCDKRTPRCTRCAAMRLDCVYQRLPPPPGGSSSSSSSDVASLAPEMPEFDMNFDIDSLGAGTNTTTTTTTTDSLHTNAGLHLDPGLDFNIADLLAGTATSAGEAELWNTQPYLGLPINNKQLHPQPPVRDIALYDRLCEPCISMDPILIHDHRSKAGYILHYITTMHVPFVQTRAMPFMHPRLWASSTPRSILAAWSAVAAYAARTPENRPWTMRLLAETVREVHRKGEAAVTHAERLARVQALLLLDSVRMLDGDVTARAVAERESGVLKGWVKDLYRVQQELEGADEAVSKDSAPKSWESWILLECIRRTVIFTLAFQCMLAVLRADPGGLEELWEDGISFTASRHLWDAPSSVDFFRAWREKPRYTIADFNFREFWLYGRPEDMDLFTKHLLTTQMGVDAVDHFMQGEISIPLAG